MRHHNSLTTSTRYFWLTTLEAEAAVLIGQGTRARELTSGAAWNVETVPGARLATAAANGLRIDGDTAGAQATYRQVWQGQRGPTRNPAGIWLADLDMCQGRFGEAIALAEQILAQCAAEDFVVRGDVERLMHLTYRFAMDFDRSLEKLHAASSLYEQAGSMVGRANMLTNTAEILTWTAPGQALTVGQQAITAQSELGALHELGKTYTAIAIAELRLGNPTGSASAFESAVRNLDRSHYRSGRARAEFFRAALHARLGDLDTAVASVVWAVEELEAAKVYPTLIGAAARLLDRLERPHPVVAQAATRARMAIHPLNTVEALEQRLDGLVRSLFDD